MGQAVAERTIFRKKQDGSWETWADVADRVTLGNVLLENGDGTFNQDEYNVLNHHMRKAIVLTSGRHLQHGDATQLGSNMERFTNCASSATSFMLFYLLLNGSGVGRVYDDDMMLVDFDNAPAIRCVLDEAHPDFDWSAHESARDAKHKYGSGRDVMWLEVPDSREGWAKAVELWEVAAFEKIHKDKLLVLDFSKVRPAGSPIGGMQNRPASGPVPLMNAINKVASVRGAGLDRWMQAMYVDHYLAECVLVGGARRAARMSSKSWRDRNVLQFIQVKRPIEYVGKTAEEVARLRNEAATNGGHPPMAFLWSSNNSVNVDDEFWRLVNLSRDEPGYWSADATHAREVFNLVTACSYGDGTGEPGFINVDKLNRDTAGLKKIVNDTYVGSSKYQLSDEAGVYYRKLGSRAIKKEYPYTVNPCAEITFFLLGAFCVIGDVAPYHADTLDEAEDGFRAMTRFLMRVNLMDSVYHKEVQRTNRIGVAITGVHEFAWKFFGLGFRDLVDPTKSGPFWEALARFNAAIKDEAYVYAKKLGVAVPHTAITCKPSGTISKLFGLTEGWHLPSMSWFLRWVQFHNDDPLVQSYKDAGYPVRKLRSYEGTSIVGFPTEPTIASMGLGDNLVTAGEASMSDQYRWLNLGETFWLTGLNGDDKGNQISYTLKYRPSELTLDQFRDYLSYWQPKIKCCSVMPQEELVSYEYQPEEPVTKARYEEILAGINADRGLAEDVGKEHVDCDSGACPVDFNEGDK